jgi:hypothetical protein
MARNSITSSADPRTDSPFARVRQSYSSVDDVTRRESVTEVVIPTRDVPVILREQYDKLTKQPQGLLF